jgi:hypothetical protein
VENASIRGLAIPFVEVRNLSPCVLGTQTGNRELEAKNRFQERFCLGDTETEEE